MHGTARARTATRQAGTGLNAVVWVERGRAIVLRDREGGEPDEIEIAIPDVAGITPPALADIAHRIGDVDRVLVLGTEDLRTALEREIVAIGHHPEAIREATLEGPVDREVLRERLRRLA
jgi:hypothetical protein